MEGMDVSKVTAAIDEAHKQLNTVIDAEFKGRRLNALRTLSLAANALTLAQTNVTKAVQQTTPKPAAPAAAKGKK